MIRPTVRCGPIADLDRELPVLDDTPYALVLDANGTTSPSGHRVARFNDPVGYILSLTAFAGGATCSSVRN